VAVRAAAADRRCHDLENWKLEVVDLDGKRIDKILATPIPPAEATQPVTPAGPV